MTRSLGTFAAGLVLGCALSLFVLTTSWWPSVEANLASLSTQDRGRLLMGRVGARFVHEHGATFYDSPKPYGSSLCRVNAYFIAEKVVRGYQESANEFWDDDLKVRMLFGVWKRPTAPDDPNITRETACAAYRDFDHLIYEGTIATAERAVYVMDVAIQQARSGKVSFALTCLDDREDSQLPKICDGVAILRNLDLKDIRQADKMKETDDRQSATRVDLIFANSREPSNCGDHPEALMFNVRNIQHFGKQSMNEADVISIDISRTCG